MLTRFISKSVSRKNTHASFIIKLNATFCYNALSALTLRWISLPFSEASKIKFFPADHTIVKVGFPLFESLLFHLSHIALLFAR